jgi:hypothetical protein
MGPQPEAMIFLCAETAPYFLCPWENGTAPLLAARNGAPKVLIVNQFLRLQSDLDQIVIRHAIHEQQ